MILNVIGPPGSGKTTYIKNRCGFLPPMQTIDDGVFETFVKRKVFEHTGLNPRINRYLDTCGEKVTTIWFQTSIPVCMYRILKDFCRQKASFKQTRSRINILRHYHRHFDQIVSGIDGPENEIVIIRTQSPVSEFIRAKLRCWFN